MYVYMYLVKIPRGYRGTPPLSNLTAIDNNDDDDVYLDKLQTRGVNNLSSTCET
jgi:hypothetical protein